MPPRRNMHCPRSHPSRLPTVCFPSALFGGAQDYLEYQVLVLQCLLWLHMQKHRLYVSCLHIFVSCKFMRIAGCCCRKCECVSEGMQTDQTYVCAGTSVSPHHAPGNMQDSRTSVQSPLHPQGVFMLSYHVSDAPTWGCSASDVQSLSVLCCKPSHISRRVA